MKTLQKLKLHNLKEICAEEQKAMKGGECWYLGSGTISGSDSIIGSISGSGLSNMLGEVTVYGGTGGVVLNAQSYIGVSECADPCENALITRWLSTTTNPYANSDETAWCSAFVNGMMIQSGFAGTNSAAANSWYNWGTSAATPYGGEVAVRSDGHHVGIVVCADGDRFLMIQGNSEGAVGETWENMSDYSFRSH